jgi:hypothetical protein
MTDEEMATFLSGNPFADLVVSMRTAGLAQCLLV